MEKFIYFISFCLLKKEEGKTMVLRKIIYYAGKIYCEDETEVLFFLLSFTQCSLLGIPLEIILPWYMYAMTLIRYSSKFSKSIESYIDI